MLDRVATLCRTVNAAVIADADTGYGGLLNACTTRCAVSRRQASSVSDRGPGISEEMRAHAVQARGADSDMVEKVKVAVEARRSTETLIIARTDARQTHGFEGAMARGQAYAEAGADVVFLEALESEEEMREACRRINKPMMANMADGGRTPIRRR